jgi:hypothetical protein
VLGNGRPWRGQLTLQGPVGRFLQKGSRVGRKEPGAVPGSTRAKIDLVFVKVTNREAQVQRLALALALTAITLCCSSASRAQPALYPAGLACQPLPNWYPRGWELMVRYPCYWVYSPSYYPPAYSSYPAGPYPAGYARQRVPIRTTHRIYRRPYLRPGWWW